MRRLGVHPMPSQSGSQDVPRAIPAVGEGAHPYVGRRLDGEDARRSRSARLGGTQAALERVEGQQDDGSPGVQPRVTAIACVSSTGTITYSLVDSHKEHTAWVRSSTSIEAT